MNKTQLIDPQHDLSIVQQCELLGLNRSNYYRHLNTSPGLESVENLVYMRMIDEQYLKTPFYGSRQMTRWFAQQGITVNRKRTQRLMRKMGIQATAPGPHTSKPHPRHKVYPYLLRGMKLQYANLVWSTDITYIPMSGGFMYLAAIIDWYSRLVINWELSNTLDHHFCLSMLENALEQQSHPIIFNTDQGSQFTCAEFTGCLLDNQILISMDGRGRALDNVFIERLWRSLKYENIYLHDYSTVQELRTGLAGYFEFYNEQRPHSSHSGRTPVQVHLEGQIPPE